MTRYEKLTNAYDYLEERILPTDRIVDLRDLEDTDIFVGIVISKYHNVLRYDFDKKEYFKVKVLN